MRRILFILHLLLLSSLMACFGAQTTEGTEFWATFLKNYTNHTGSTGMTLTLIVSSRENATVTIQNPQTGWQQSISVSANRVAEYIIPHNQGYTDAAGNVQKRGLKITSTAPISLYASNYDDATYDASIVLPTPALGKDYIIQVFENELYSKEFAIVATTNNTTITITPHARTTNGHVKNVPYTITLNAGETYQVMSEDGNSDFSGTKVESNYPIAVFAGHQCINVPTGNPWCDHIVEQQMPTPMWGKQFALTKTSSMSGDRVMITAKEDNTIVKINGVQKTTLKSLESYTFRLTDNSAFVETSEPATCFLYIEGARANGMNGDPSSIHISPIEQRISELTFATFETNRSRSHYVNIVTTNAGVASMTLDDRNISSYFQPLQGNNTLQYARVSITHGTHTLRNSKDGFIGHVYGLGDCESYAYTFGSATLILDGSILVDGEPHADMTYIEQRCFKAPIHFAAHANVEYNSIHWDFGDGSTSTQPEVSHTYSSPGTYTITMVITNEDGRDTTRTTLTLYDTLRDTISATICEGETYTVGTQQFNQSGEYTITLTSQAGCDSIVHLNLTVHNKHIVTENAEFNKGSAYRWHNKWYREAGIYKDTLLSSYGCDSIVELHLVEVDPTEIIYDTICWQATYPFRGYDFPLPPIDGYEDVDFIDYTLAYTDKELCITYKINLAIIPKEGGGVFITNDTIQLGQTYEWMGDFYTEEGTYEKIMGGSEECKYEYQLNLTVVPFPINVTEMTLCHEDSIVWREKTYDKAGVYTDTIFSLLGIESIERLILKDNRSRTEINISNVNSYDFNGQILTESGTYYDTIPNAAGCDSVIILHLGIDESCEINVEENMSLCEGESIMWNGQNCIAGNDYVAKFTSVGGCDSIVTLHIDVLEKKQETISVTICEGDFYKVGEERFSEEGEHIIHLTAANGCDSIITLNLRYNDSYADTTFAAINIGEEYSWQGDSYRTEGTYAKGCIASNGCDSLQVLCLTVDKNCQFTRDTNVVLCYGESIIWYDSTYTISGEYQHLLDYNDRCDTLVTMHLTILSETITDTAKIIIADNDIPYLWRGQTYNATGQYTDIVKYATTDCDSAIYVLDLTVLTTGAIEETDTTICESALPFLWYDSTLISTGKYTHDETYKGTDIDSIQHILNLTINPTKYTEETVVACDSYTWNGETYTTSGDYVYTTIAANGCDSIVTLHLTINNSEIGETEYATICYGETYTWNGQTYSTEGEYSITLSNTLGCDSVATLHLTIMPEAITTTETVVIGNDELPYAWRGNTYSATGRYTVVEQYTAVACDSAIHILDLTVLTTGNHDEQSVTICETEAPYLWYGESYSATGKYTYTEKYVGTDIDSIQHILNLTVNPTVYTEEHMTACDSYTWNGETYTQSGEYVYTTVAANGCDSIVTLHLTINQTQYAEVTATACDSYTWNGETYTQSGDYVYTTVAANGCDSIVTLHLTINYSEVSAPEYATICHGETYTWNGQTYSTEGEYSITLQNALGCDSVATLHLTIMPEAVTTTETVVIGNDELPYAWRGNTYSATGRYTVVEQYTAVACDSAIHILDLTVLTTGNHDEQSVTICETEAPYLWYGESYSATGKYTYTEKYAGTDIDSIQHILNLTVNPTVYTEEHITACNSYVWNGETYTESGDYVYTTTAANGCDSIVTLHLIINQSEVGAPEFATICYGETYTWNGQTYSTEGEYSITLSNTLGCDSVATLHLTIMPEAVTTTETVVIGSDELPYTWRGNTYSATGRYTVVEQYTTVACDSAIHVLDLTVLTTGNHDEQSVTICETEAPYTWYGESYSATGKYTYTEKYAGTDIDSIQHILNLTVNPTVYTEETNTACDSYTWNGETYTQSGDYTYTTVAANGCDSIVTLHLTINQTQYAEESVIACDSYAWNGETYTASGDYVYTTVAANGCDSVVTLNLTILPEVPAITIDTTICYGETYTWNGQTYSASGTYNITLQNTNGCDSVVTLQLTVLPEAVTETETVTIESNELPYIWRGQSYNATGQYTEIVKYVTADCDSAIYVLDLTVLTTGAIEETDTIICETALPYLWYNQSLTASGKYTHIDKYTGTDIDSVQHILTLTIVPTTYTTIDTTICYGTTIDWQGVSYATNGSYTTTLTSVAGCDSIVTLNLTILPEAITEQETITIGSEELPYLWRGQSYNATGQYTEIVKYVTADCDSAIYVLDLTVLTTGAIEETDTIICETALPYLWYNQSLTASGKYTHIDKYTGTDIDSVQHILTLTIVPTTYTTIDTTICYGTTIDWQGVSYATNGSYTTTLTSVAGCDSIVTLNLTILPEVPVTSIDTTICYGETYTWNGQTYSASGTYNITLQNTNGCDSVVTLQLTVLPETVTETEIITIESNELPYTWRGNTYTATGQYTIVEQYATIACDSVIHVLDLTVLTTGNHDEQSVTICETEAPYLWYGESYSATGKYTYTEKYVGTDIDSIQHILNLTVNPTKYAEESITACDSYTWNGETYTTSGDYVYTTTATNGCDSIVTLHLTINNTQYAEESVVACDSYTWNGETYTTSGDYVYTTAANGCDSIVTLHLTINNSEIGETEYATICYDETYTWNGQTYSTEGEYSITLSNTLGCDSVATLHLTIMPEALTTTETVVVGSDELPYTWHGNTYSATGRYTVVEQYTTVACDSAIYVLDLTVLTTGAIEETDTIICESALPFLWYDQSLTASGKYTHIEKYAGIDIDSVQHILNLIISPTTYTTIDTTIMLGETYFWNGIEYNTSGEYVDTLQNISNCDSVVTLILTVLDNQVNIRDIQIEEQCADANTVEIIIDVEGIVDSVGLSFNLNNPNIVSSGLYDTIVPMPMDGHISIPYTNIRAGKYEAILAGYFYQRVVFSENISLTFLYPSSVLEQRWNDVVAVLAKDYNGGYDFVAFQWYKDGEMIVGETRSYYSEPFEMGSEYSALLTEADGTQLMTCPIIIEKHTDITLYPTIVATAQQIHCNVSLEGQLYLYDSTGKLYMHHSLNQGDNYISAPNVAGIYLAKIVLMTGEEKDVKILVL